MDAFIFYTFKSSLCLSVGFLLYFLLVRRETFHRIKRFLLLGIIISSLFIPLIKLQVHSPVIGAPMQKLENRILKQEPVIIPEQIYVQQPVIKQEPANPLNLLALLYILGATIQLSLILYALVMILLLIRKSTKLEYAGMKLLLGPDGIVPFCFGRRIIISEKDFRQHGKEMILHEQAHLNQMHSLDLFIAELYLIITWYNPVSWLIRNELKQNHEFEADRNVIRQGINESDYQLLLVKAVAGEFRFLLANQFHQSDIKTRIKMMNREKSGYVAILKTLVFIPLIALLVMAFAPRENIISNVSMKKVHGKYLELNSKQLQLLGFDWNSEGLFYKNRRPNKRTLLMYFTDSVYSASIILEKGEKLQGHGIPDKILRNQSLGTFDFKPLIVANVRGSRTLVLGGLHQYDNKKLLPIQVNLGSLAGVHRTDTLVFWFTPSESLAQVLSPFVRIENYLQYCPPDSK